VEGDPANAGRADSDAQALGHGHFCIPNDGLKVETELERLSTRSAGDVPMTPPPTIKTRIIPPD